MAEINHVFVLMLENQSFDRLLGQSGISGYDPIQKKIRSVDGSELTMSNLFQGKSYFVTNKASTSLTSDPNHEFEDVFEQLTGQTFGKFKPGSPYPTPTNNGFVQNYAKLNPTDLGEIMSGYSPDKIPVLTKLATEFAVCDKWFSSLPGPTWPNRFFLHGGSSGGLDHSPSMGETLKWETGVPGGFEFPNGSIFDQLKRFGISFRFYRGNKFPTDDYPIVSALKGITPSQSHSIADFAKDLKNDYETFYTFIEPSYGNIINNTYKGGTSQHPMDDVRGGEQLIKQVYEAIRNSPVWDTSLLIITWDEHGGFFDHVSPPSAKSPGDHLLSSRTNLWDKLKSWISGEKNINKHGFKFDRYGVRVPAVVVSPWIPRNTVDGTLYDHSSVLATLRSLKPELTPLTSRDTLANKVTHLLSLSSARSDCPTELKEVLFDVVENKLGQEVEVSDDLVDHGNASGFAYLAMRAQLEGAVSAVERESVQTEFRRLKTHRDLGKFFDKSRLRHK